MRLSTLEKETIINYNEAEPTATIYTHNIALQNKLERLCVDRPNEVKRTVEYQDGGKQYEVPKKFVRLTVPPQLSDAQRAKRAEAAKRFHQRREITP